MTPTTSKNLTTDERDYIEKALGSGLINPSEMRIVLFTQRLTTHPEAPTLIQITSLWQWCKNQIDGIITNMGVETVKNNNIITPPTEGDPR